MRERIALDVREAEHQSAEAEHGQEYGEEVGLHGFVRGTEVVQPERGQHQGERTDRRQRQEDRAPAVRVGLPSAEGRADGRGHAHGHAHHAHRHAAAGERVDREHGDLQHRPHHAGADGLQHTAEQHEDERGGDPCHQRTDGEDRHGCDHDLTGGETTGQVGGQRHHHAHDQLEDGGQPLAGGHRNAELGNDSRQRGAQLQLGEVAAERNERQDGDGHHGRMGQMPVGERFLRGQWLAQVALDDAAHAVMLLSAWFFRRRRVGAPIRRSDPNSLRLCMGIYMDDGGGCVG